METDSDRRSQLRSFLMYLRSRISPAEVGLPHAGVRRVPGLRREEVAELIGVSEDWYRWFESGRPVSVSQRFLANLSEKLKLNAYDRLTLYRLSLPELYQADSVANAELHSSHSSLSPITLPSDIDSTRRAFEAARNSFLQAEPKDLDILRSRIIGSWNRSRSLQVDATIERAPARYASDDGLMEAREANYALLTAASPIVGELATAFGDMGYAIAITDRSGGVLQVDGDRAARRLIERSGVVPGGDLSEDAVGTNGIGTVIADKRPLQLMAEEHFVEAGRPLTCTGAPIRDPRDGSILGVLVVMSDYRLVRPSLLPSTVKYALEIEEQLAKSVLLAQVTV